MSNLQTSNTMQFYLDQIRYKGVRQPVIITISNNRIFVNNTLFPLNSIISVFMLDNALIFTVGIPIKSEIVFRGKDEVIQILFNVVYGLCCGSQKTNYTNNLDNIYE